MKGYILTVFISSLVIVIFRYLADRRSSVAAYLDLIASLITVLILLEPLLALFKDFKDSVSLPRPSGGQVSFESGDETLLTMAEKRLSQRINQMLRDEFGMIADNVQVTLYYNEEDALFLIEEITVTIKEKERKDAISAYLSEEFKTDITVLCGEVSQ